MAGNRTRRVRKARYYRRRRQPYRIIALRRRSSNWLGWIGLGFFLALALWYTAPWLSSVVAFNLIRVQIAEEGILEETLVTFGLIIRDERVLTSPATGRFQRYAPEADRIRVGSTLAWVERDDGSRVELKSPWSGTVSYRLDGLEAAFTPASASNISVKSILGTEFKISEVVSGAQVRQGMPLLKIIPASEAYVAVSIPEKDANDIIARGNAGLRLPGEREVQNGSVYWAGDNVQNGFVVLTLKVNEVKGWLLERRVKVEIVKRSVKGIIVPRSSLWEQDGETGIYIMRETKPVFVTVRVKGLSSRSAAVEGVDPGTRIVVNPGVIKGLRWKRK